MGFDIVSLFPAMLADQVLRLHLAGLGQPASTAWSASSDKAVMFYKLAVVSCGH